MWLQIQVPLFDLFTTFQQIQFEEGAEKINFCAPKNKHVPAFFTDLDGSLDPRPSYLRRTLPSTIMSNDVMMKQFVDESRCTEVTESCSLHCRNTCFRGIRFNVDQAGTEDYLLRVCKALDPTNCMEYHGYYRGDDPTNSDKTRMFDAYLPSGKYSAVFVTESGKKVWPSFVEIAYQQDELCPTALKEGDVVMEVPTPDANVCSQLIRNQNIEFLEDGMHPIFWLHKLGGVGVAKGAGVGKSNALTSTSPDATNTIVQFIDNRCMHSMAGNSYEITAWVKLVDKKGIAYACDPMTEVCPEAGIMGPWGRERFAMLASQRSSEGFQLLQGAVTISGQLATQDVPLAFYLRSNTNLQWYIDNVSMKLIKN